MAFDEKLFWHKRSEYNREMINLARRASRSFKANIRELMPNGTGELARDITYRTKKRDGSIIRLGWSTQRYGFIREQGFSKTTKAFNRRPPGSGESGEKTVRVRPHTRSLAPKPWIKQTMDNIHPEAANIAARIKGDDLIAEYDAANEGFIGQTKFGI